ncbi:extracellular solute-binding protein [Thalassoroseus pseudoceratinae]|uniref:extracellular solute-binding protein n=1 Tax=Thalassoroseus pseudoceratinae TaxID=2713176 RepID=UPI0014215C8D|nr:extracellular solute-binding protein [Thalassoroseus pseudoceratinae]
MQFSESAVTRSERERIVFWHFWGGTERTIVQDIVRRFNDSQDLYWVDEIAVPGQNLDMKFFMSLQGGDAPDLLNQDDQVIAQWANAGVLMPIRELCPDEQTYHRLEHWLYPPARQIGTYDNNLYAICNALDIRLLFYRESAIEPFSPPKTISQLDQIAKRPATRERSIAYLPDNRRLWAWGIAFGGDFYDEEQQLVTPDHPKVIEALEWMTSYTDHLGLDQIRAFRSTNREAGAGSMLRDGRYSLMMDGQWRVAELDRVREESSGNFQYGVTPLPYPSGGRPNAGWVNGNFFVVPKDCQKKRGVWEFIKFWSGFDGHEADAALTASSGGWIPASPSVTAHPHFQKYLDQHPRFRLFVELAESEYQVPTPAIPVQAYYYERVNQAADEALTLQKTPAQALQDAARDVQLQLDKVQNER